MKIKGNEKCHACPRVLASVVFRYPVFRRYSGIPLSFRGGPAVPLVFRVPLFRCSVSVLFFFFSFSIHHFTSIQIYYL